MKRIICTLLLSFLLFPGLAFAQNSDNSLVLKAILENYYKNEKPVYKGRSQLLYLYCNQANNNEELFEAVRERKLSDDFLKEIRTTIKTDLAERNWDSELQSIFEADKSKLRQKVSACVTLEKYQQISKRFNENNQRLMIISKPLYYSKSNIALVKVVFYRNIEHNSGVILLLEKNADNWTIKEFLNPWST